MLVRMLEPRRVRRSARVASAKAASLARSSAPSATCSAARAECCADIVSVMRAARACARHREASQRATPPPCAWPGACTSSWVRDRGVM